METFGPIFAAGVAVQQILEVFSVIVEKYVGEKRKKSVLGVIGFVVGIILARAFGLDVMQYFQLNSNIAGIDTIVTALVLSAGTEGTNSIVKFLKYLKEDKKTTAAESLEQLGERTGDKPARRTLEKLRRRDGVTAPAAAAAAAVTARSGGDAIQAPSLAFISSK